jgi:hypothetical protein
MTKLEWANKEYIFGVDRGVIYPEGSTPMVWNGLKSVQESSEDVSESTIFVDGVRVVRGGNPGVFYLEIDALDYPYFQSNIFDMSYRTTVPGGYIIHLVYGLTISGKVDVSYTSIGSDEISSISFTAYTRPNRDATAKSYSHVTIDTRNASPVALQQVEDLIYGTPTTTPSVPTLNDLIAIFDAQATFIVVDYGDGTWKAIGPASMISAIDGTSYKITTPSIEYVSDDTYKIRSW